MATNEQAGDGRGGAADDPAARARAYLDLWEHHLVHAAVRTRIGPAAPETQDETAGEAVDAAAGGPPLA
jgi:hypothetical protein